MIRRWRPTLISKDRQPAWAATLNSIGGGRPASTTSDGAAGVDALVAAVRRACRQGGADVVIGKHGGKLVGGGVADAVEVGEAAVALPEEAQHRHHAVDGRDENARRLVAARGEGLAQRQEVDHAPRGWRRDCG